MKSRSPDDYLLDSLVPNDQVVLLNRDDSEFRDQLLARSIRVDSFAASEKDFRFFSFKRDSLSGVYFDHWLRDYSRDDLNRILSHLAFALKSGALLLLASSREKLPPELHDPLSSLVKQCGFRFEGRFDSPATLVWVHRAPEIRPEI